MRQVSCLVLSLFLPASILTAQVARDDSYLLSGETLDISSARGLLANDTFSGEFDVVVVDPPQEGVLELHSDGSFRYTPDPGTSGDILFTYQLVSVRNEIPFEIQRADSSAAVSVVLDTPFGKPKDSSNSSIGGSLDAELTFDRNGVARIQITKIDTELRSRTKLKFCLLQIFGVCTSELEIEAMPGDLRLSLLEPGPVSSLTNGRFEQKDNVVAIEGEVATDASGIGQNLVDDEAIVLDGETVTADLEGRFRTSGSEATITLPIDFPATEFVLDEGTEATAEISVKGSLVATADLNKSPLRPLSNTAAVRIRVPKSIPQSLSAPGLTVNPTGELVLTFVGDSGDRYRIMRSSDLRNWVALPREFTADGEGLSENLGLEDGPIGFFRIEKVSRRQ